MILDLHGFGPALLAGTLMTIQLALASLAVGLVLGLLGALAKTSSRRPLQWLGGAYSTVVRGVPELIWILLLYYGLSALAISLADLLGMATLELSPFATGTIALGLCFGAYATEVFRGAILAIPKGHREAGLALGLSGPRILWRLILPQMWRIALPGLGNLFMILMKDTALVSAITLNELMNMSKIAVSASKEPFTFYLAAATIYLCLTAASMVCLHFLEQRASRGFVRSAA
jgi:polar amino acid transport system permease protein